MSRMERRRLEEHQKVLEKQNKKASPFSIFLKILVVLALLAAIATLIAYWYVNSKLNKLGELKINADVESFAEYDLSCVDVDGYINVLVLGIDARDMNEPDEEWRSDAIMIASIKEETGDVYLTSLYRDTLFYLPDEEFYDKITHAFSYGGVQETMKTINQSLDLNIKNYVVFNISACVDIIDAMGGLDLTIEDYEISELNKYNRETWRICGKEGTAPSVETAGTQHVDGSLAVTYGRIRKGVGDDYKRTERMRIVVGKMLEKAKTLSFKEIDGILDIGLPQVKTNLSNSDIMGLGFKLFNFNMAGTTSFPFNITDGFMGAVSYVFPTDLFGDVAKLHREFFGQQNYKPSETVFTHSSIISQYAMGSWAEPSGEVAVGDGNEEMGGSSLWYYIPEPEPESLEQYENYEYYEETETGGEEPGGEIYEPGPEIGGESGGESGGSEEIISGGESGGEAGGESGGSEGSGSGESGGATAEPGPEIGGEAEPIGGGEVTTPPEETVTEGGGDAVTVDTEG